MTTIMRRITLSQAYLGGEWKKVFSTIVIAIPLEHDGQKHPAKNLGTNLPRDMVPYYT
jgi:hypothetical protein